MKRIIFFSIIPILSIPLLAGVIVKKNGENLEDVSIINVTASEIIYVDENNQEQIILKEEASAILYDDGRYEEITSFAQPSTPPNYNNTPEKENYSNYRRGNNPQQTEASAPVVQKQYKSLLICAFGKKVNGSYQIDNCCDGAIVQWNKSVEDRRRGTNNEYEYLGMVPSLFVYMQNANQSSDVQNYIYQLKQEFNNSITIQQIYDKINLQQLQLKFRILIDGRPPIEIMPEISYEEETIFVYLPLDQINSVSQNDTNNNDTHNEIYQNQNINTIDSEVSEITPVQLVPVTISTTIEPAPQPKSNDRLEVKPLAIDDSKGAGGSMSIRVDATGQWEIADYPKWCFVTKNPNTVIVEVPRNTTADKRAGNIQIKMRQEDGNYIYKSVRVTQSASMNYLELSTDLITDPVGKGGKLKVDVYTDCNGWKVEGLPSWCWLSEQTSNSFTLILEKNTTGIPREATARVNCGSHNQNITISQK